MTETDFAAGSRSAEFRGQHVSRDSRLDLVPPLTPSNWQEEPYNRWAFAHVEELVPTARIHRSAGADRLPSSSGESLDERVPGLEMFLTESYTDAILVVQDDEVLYERYFEGNSASTRHLLMSVSKSLCGLTIGQLVEAGVVDRNETVGAYVPALIASAYGDATIQQVLDMTVAVEFSEEYHDPHSHVQQQDRVAGWRPRSVRDPMDNYEFLKTLRKAGDHGKAFQYCSAGTDVLAWVAENVTGVRYADILSRELWSRLGADDDAVITTDPGGFVFANGGIACTARDLSRVGRLMLSGGVLDGRQVVSPDWIADTRLGGERAAAAGTAYQRVHPRGSYRNQWWVTGDDRGSVYAIGIHGQFVWVDPPSNSVIVKFSSWPEAITEEWNRMHAAAFRSIAEAIDHR